MRTRSITAAIARAHADGCTCEPCFKVARATFEAAWRARADRVRRMEAARAALAALVPTDHAEIVGEIAAQHRSNGEIEVEVATQVSPPPKMPRADRVAAIARLAAPRASGDGVLLVGWGQVARAVGLSTVTLRRRMMADDPPPVTRHGGTRAVTAVAAEIAAWKERARVPARREARTVAVDVPAGDADEDDEPEPPLDLALTEAATADPASPEREAPTIGARVRWYSAPRDMRVSGRVVGAVGRVMTVEDDVGVVEQVDASTLSLVAPHVFRQGTDGAARHRRERGGVMRSTTLSVKRIGRNILNLPVADYEDEFERPRTRGDCRGDARPCPWVSCRHHLYLDVNPETGSIKIVWPDREPWEIPETCSLDVAERGGITLEETGETMNLTRERVRQVEFKSAMAVRALMPEDTGEALAEILAGRAERDASRMDGAAGNYEGWGDCSPATAADPAPDTEVASEPEAA